MNIVLIKLLLLRFASGSAPQDIQDISLIHCNALPVLCDVSIPHGAETDRCKLRRRQDVLTSRRFYKLTRNGQKKVIKFPLQFVPFLNQTIERVSLHTAQDPIDSNWFAQITAFKAVTKKLESQLETAFAKAKFSHEIDYKKIYLMHNMQIKYLHTPHFSNPSIYPTFTNIINNKRYLSDDIFAQQRVAGPCPFLIRLVTQDGRIGFKWSELKKLLNTVYDFDAALQFATKEKSFTMVKAVKEERLYALYHEENNGLETVTDYFADGDGDDQTLIHVTSPIALFARTVSGDLKVVAIQMDYKKKSPVYSPLSNAFTWMMAKARVNSGDLNICQAVWHLSHIHLSAGVYCTIFKSHFSELHPIYQIMQYHCEGTAPHIALTYGALVAPNMYGHKLFSISNTGYINLTVTGFKRFRYGILAYDNIMKSNGLDSDKLKYHPFRDDGGLIWSAFKRFAKSFTDAYYKSDADVGGDDELQGFAKQVSIDGGSGDLYGGKGNIVGFPPSFSTKHEIKIFITRFLWQIAMHGAINYPLEPWTSFVPLYPTKLYNYTNNGHEFKETLYRALPDKLTTISATTFAELLGNLRINRIFDYYDKLKDTKLSELVRKYHYHFHNCMQQLLEQRNKRRKDNGEMGFQYLEPKWLTSSVHI